MYSKKWKLKKKKDVKTSSLPKINDVLVLNMEFNL